MNAEEILRRAAVATRLTARRSGPAQPAPAPLPFRAEWEYMADEIIAAREQRPLRGPSDPLVFGTPDQAVRQVPWSQGLAAGPLRECGCGVTWRGDVPCWNCGRTVAAY